jgi:hypothetical protein
MKSLYYLYESPRLCLSLDLRLWGVGVRFHLGDMGTLFFGPLRLTWGGGA